MMVNNSLFIFGGYDKLKHKLNERMWVFHIEEKEFEEVASFNGYER